MYIVHTFLSCHFCVYKKKQQMREVFHDYAAYKGIE